MAFDPKEARALVEHFKNDQPVTQDMQSTMMAEEMQLAADTLAAALAENQRLREALDMVALAAQVTKSDCESGAPASAFNLASGILKLIDAAPAPPTDTPRS